MKKCRSLWLCLILLAAASDSRAEDEEKSTEDAAPDLELLEFIGAWELEDGEWFDTSERHNKHQDATQSPGEHKNEA